MQSIRPENLRTEELLRYAYLEFHEGLNKEWSKAVLDRLAQVHDTLDGYKPFQQKKQSSY